MSALLVDTVCRHVLIVDHIGNLGRHRADAIYLVAKVPPLAECSRNAVLLRPAKVEICANINARFSVSMLDQRQIILECQCRPPTPFQIISDSSQLPFMISDRTNDTAWVMIALSHCNLADRMYLRCRTQTQRLCLLLSFHQRKTLFILAQLVQRQMEENQRHVP